VRYRADAEPITTRQCWCRLCQYLGGGNSMVNICFATSSFTIERGLDVMRDFVSIADSGNELHRRFCTICGTPMFSEAAARPHLIFARAGTLDDPNIAKPAMAIWTAQAPVWACIDPALPKIGKQPPPAA
jgi:hypothetical protein